MPDTTNLVRRNLASHAHRMRDGQFTRVATTKLQLKRLWLSARQFTQVVSDEDVDITDAYITHVEYRREMDRFHSDVTPVDLNNL